VLLSRLPVLVSRAAALPLLQMRCVNWPSSRPLPQRKSMAWSTGFGMAVPTRKRGRDVRFQIDLGSLGELLNHLRVVNAVFA